MKRVIIGFTVFLIITAFVSQKNLGENKMKSFHWLKGSWGMKTVRGMINEKWKMLNDSSFAGESFMVRANGETQLLETIELVFRDNHYYYIPTAQGQNDNKPVKFKITSYAETGFVAENPEHDFPKRITYRLINKDSIHAFIDGGYLMAEKKSDFYYSRIKN